MITFEKKRLIVIGIAIIILSFLLLLVLIDIFRSGYREGYLQCLKNASQLKFDITGIPKN